jgi:type IX secretion system PorP/SprF family membrane protein
MNRHKKQDRRRKTSTMRMVLIVFCLMSNVWYLKSQDIHFSQFNFSPLNQSPALTNFFDGDYRFIGNYRNQWPSVPVSYNTVSLSAEMNFVTLKNNDRVGGGILLFYDKEGDSRFTSLSTDLSFSYIKSIGKDNHHAISLGLQAGLVNRSFDYTQLNFDNQWNGDIYDPNTPVNENFARTRFTVFDLGAGLAYRYKKTDRTNFLIGFGAMHLNQPKQSFFNDNVTVLGPRFTANTRVQVQLTGRLDIVPELMFQQQQSKQEFDLGGHFKYYLQTRGEHIIALNLGAYGRVADAGWLMAGVDYDNLQVNLSYDVNFSHLNAASRYNGGFEMSVIYILARVKKVNKPGAVCPAFL